MAWQQTHYHSNDGQRTDPSDHNQHSYAHTQTLDYTPKNSDITAHNVSDTHSLTSVYTWIILKENYGQRNLGYIFVTPAISSINMKTLYSQKVIAEILEHHFQSAQQSNKKQTKNGHKQMKMFPYMAHGVRWWTDVGNMDKNPPYVMLDYKITISQSQRGHIQMTCFVRPAKMLRLLSHNTMQGRKSSHLRSWCLIFLLGE